MSWQRRPYDDLLVCYYMDMHMHMYMTGVCVLCARACLKLNDLVTTDRSRGFPWPQAFADGATTWLSAGDFLPRAPRGSLLPTPTGEISDQRDLRTDPKTVLKDLSDAGLPFFQILIS